MSLQEILKEMEGLQQYRDHESSHIDADRLLCETIKRLAVYLQMTEHDNICLDILKAYSRVGKWYS